LAYIVRPSDDRQVRGELVGLVHQSDIGFEESTEAKRYACDAASLALLGEMTASVSHDFRNILAVIEASLRLAEKSELPERARVYVAAAREGISRGGELTSQLLSFVKKRKLEPRAEDANKLLGDLEPFLQHGAGPNSSVVLDLAPDIPQCLLDPSQFNAAILNLVINARDAMPDGGQIHISTAQLMMEPTHALPTPGNYVRVRVEDEGQGMPEELVQQIFDPFFTTKGEQGTGLGLPQVSAFMRLVGGYISIASEWGHGTTFDLLFPVSLAGEDRTLQSG
jgi:signal transduction histidine kinase